MTAARYLVAGSTPWSRRAFMEMISRYPGTWRFIQHPDQLTIARVRRLAPRALFFLHWSWKVPEAIVNAYPCIGFHMTDLPYGRGGSPLQHLILRGHRHTKLTAFQMTEGMDAGPVYVKEPLRLDGSAGAIYLRASFLAAKMIRSIIAERLVPRPQRGRSVVFKRRRAAESRIPAIATLARLHDFIRMLDADGYPRAFLDYQGFRYAFSRAARADRGLTADVRIALVEREPS